MPYGFNENKTKIEVVSNSMVSAQLKTDLLDVNFTDSNATKNQRMKVWFSPSSPASNFPYDGSQTFIGVWDYIWFATNSGMVMVTEMHPVPGRVWVNFAQNGAFEGWQHTPEEHIRPLESTPVQRSNLIVERMQASESTTISAGTNQVFTFAVARENRMFLGVIGAAPGNTNCAVTGVTGKDSSSTNGVNIWVRNNSSSDQTTRPVIWVLYA